MFEEEGRISEDSRAWEKGGMTVAPVELFNSQAPCISKGLSLKPPAAVRFCDHPFYRQGN